MYLRRYVRFKNCTLFIQFKNVTTLLKALLFRGCFSRFLNCISGTKLRKTNLPFIGLPHSQLLDTDDSLASPTIATPATQNFFIYTVTSKFNALISRMFKIWLFLLKLFVDFFKINFKSLKKTTAWKVSAFRVFLVRIFSHSVWIRKDTVHLRIQSECGKIPTRKTPNMDTFHAVDLVELLSHPGKSHSQSRNKLIHFMHNIIFRT